jgi:hypothetical protein
VVPKNQSLREMRAKQEKEKFEVAIVDDAFKIKK